jgi:hypothetical protein
MTENGIRLSLRRINRREEPWRQRLERTGHEYFPRATWGVVVPALLRLTEGSVREPA